METFLELYVEFLQYKKKRVKPNSHKAYCVMASHIREERGLAEMQFNRVRLVHLQDFLDSRRLKVSSIKNFKIYLNQFYKYCKKNGFETTINISDLELPFQDTVPQDDRDLKVIELSRLIKTPHYLEFSLMFLTGCRLGECLALTIQDFNFNDMTININKTVTRFGIGSPKTKDSIRVIPLPQQLIPLIEKRLGEIERVWDGEHIMVSKYSGKIKSTTTIQSYFKKLYPNLHVHHLRHHFITCAVESNVNIQAIKKLVGHSKDSNEIFRTYTHLSRNYVTEEYSKIEF